MHIMDTTADEIQRAAMALGFPSERFRRLSTDEARWVYESSLRYFVPYGQPRWWWEHFPFSTAVHFPEGNGWRYLNNLVPNPDERVWFIAEDFVTPGYSVWEASVRDVHSIIGECYGFEFYLIQQEFHWLVCENHHDVIVAVGREVEERLRAYDAD